MSVIAAYYYNESRRIREVAIDERIALCPPSAPMAQI